MDPKKFLEIQKNMKNNVNTLNTYLTDLQTWESEMKRKEAALKGEYEQNTLPPVRSKLKKDKPVVPVKKPEKRIPSYDYQAWDKFDVDKVCEQIDMAEVGPTSLDSKKSEKDKKGKLREEAQYEKERGNTFVKQEKWDDAISCYNRAIELVNNDPIYYANRGLCYLKKESLHQAEKDCTEALKLDPTYVKALQRRATAREKLGSLRSATEDLNKVIELEPNNNAAKKQLQSIKLRMGTKGSKSKSSPQSSPQSTPTNHGKPFPETTNKAKIVELSNETTSNVLERKPAVLSAAEKWRLGENENVTIMKAVKKPPHLRSKKALKRIQITETPLGKSEKAKPATRMAIVEIENGASGDKKNDTNNNSNVKGNKEDRSKGSGDHNNSSQSRNGPTSVETDKLKCDTKPPAVDTDRLVAPTTSVQFMATWKNLRGHDQARARYLSLIDPSKIPTIFANALESDVLSDILCLLNSRRDMFSHRSLSGYLRGLAAVKRFSALAMFLTDEDKEVVNKLLVHCRTKERCDDDAISDLKNKYELYM